MSSQSRSKQPIRGAKGKAARRPAVKSGAGVPILAVAVAAILLVFFAGLVVYGVVSNRTNSVPVVHGSSGDITCDQGEHAQTHYHVALQILDQGTLHPIPGGIGIVGGETAPTCDYWLHVHSANQDVIHIEAPSDRQYTLGDFFKVWDSWSVYSGDAHQRLDETHISTLILGQNQKLVIYIDLDDGKGPQLYTGDPAAIVLKSHETITLEITPPTTSPPPTIDWSSGSYAGL